MTSKLDRCEREKTSSPPLKISQFFDKNEEDQTRKRAKDSSMKHCEQTGNGTAMIGDPIGRKLPLHHLHTNGVNTKTRRSMARSTLVERVMAIDYLRISRIDNSECRARPGESEDRTLCRTHFSQCHGSQIITRTCVWLKFGDVLHLCAS